MTTPSIQQRAVRSRNTWLQWLDITPVQLIYLEGALAAFLAIGSLTWPLGVDQAWFYTVGNTILQGGIPYKDAFELKGPLTYYICAAIIAVFGNREIGIRIFDLLLVVYFCWWLKSTAWRVEGKSALGVTFTVVFFGAYYYGGLGFWYTAQPDGWGGLLVAVTVALLLEESSRPIRRMAAVGVLIALAALLKPTFLIFSPLPLLYLPCDGRELASRLVPRGVYVLSCISTITLALALVFRHGGLEDYCDILHFLSSSYTPFLRRHLSDEARLIPQLLWEFGLTALYILVLPAVGYIWYSGYTRRAFILSTWFFLATLMVFVQGKYYLYHFTAATIAATVVVGNSLSLFGRSQVTPHVRTFATGFAALIIGLSVVTSDLSDYLFGTLQWPGYVFGFIDKSDYMLRVAYGYPGDPDRVASYIDSHSNEGDTIFLWSWNIRVLAMGKRQPATRFGTFEALITEGPLQAKYRHIFLSDISRRPPRYVVVDCLDSSYRPESSLWLLSDFKEFNHFLRERYKIVTRIGAFQIWEKT